MSITDELREYARIHQPYKSELYNAKCADEITAIADRIDAEHERAMADAYLSGTPTDEKLTELGWIRLPKDADDVPWNVGDRDEDGNEVIALKLAPDGWYVVTVGEWPYRPEHKRHYHAPTVEDVLEELLREYDRDDSELTNGEIIEMFAKRLTLAEGEDA